MIKYNHLDFLNERQLNYMPAHFATTKLPEYCVSETTSWIKSKLGGRFFVLRIPTISNNDKLITEFVVGFEDQKELTYFMLACPHLRRN
jgi:hypothetical protein